MIRFQQNSVRTKPENKKKQTPIVSNKTLKKTGQEVTEVE